MRKFAYIPEYVQEVDDTWTFNWWRRQVPSGVPEADTIGLHSVRGTP